MRRLTTVICLLLGLSVASGCSSHWAEAKATFEGSCWNLGDTISLDFESTDTSKVFALGFPLTVDDDYPFNNIYVHAILTAPSGDASVIPAEFVLADRTGNWLTEASGEQATFDLKVADGLRFNQLGKYKLRLFHFMRDPQLCGVEQVGISLDPLEI